MGTTLISWFVFLLLAIPVVFILLVRFRRKPLAVFHRVVTNPITSKFAARLPGFGVIANVGRKSGKLYRTPVNVFRCEEGFLIALTYGRESGWVGNVVAAGSSELETRGVSYQLVSPKLVRDPHRRRFPFFVRMVLGLMDANDYLELQLRPDNPERRV